jgi:phosphoenolpyruvate-protein phosphotransferase
MSTRQNILRDSEIAFHGMPLATGIARGKAYLLKRVDLLRFQNDKRTVNLVSSELARLELAVERSINQVSGFMRGSLHGTEDTSYPIFEAELRLLNDPAIVSSLKETIRRTKLHGESVLAYEIARLRDSTSASTDELTEKGLITMQDLYYRILYNMRSDDEDRVTEILKQPAGSILIADRLTPVEVAVIPIDKVAGILIEEGTRSSHASIMAQTLGVPVIINFPGIGALLDESTEVLIDAYRGNVFLNPSEMTLKECLDRDKNRKPPVNPVEIPVDASTVHCPDGLAVRLLCNASNLADILHAHRQGIMEIGLFRSEIRYLTGTEPTSAEQEAAYYTSIFGVEGIAGMTLRLLDMGGDKLPVYMQMEKETDPQLGCRGIRLLLSRPEVMKKQLRAILTARGTSHVRLLLPFITTIDDLTNARKIINEVAAEMKVTSEPPHIGIMVEVPSVALSIERFLPKVDFVCLGTNDLVQYFFAVNRDQTGLRKYNRFTHPVFLKMINDIIAVCLHHGKHLTVCGEMASDPVGCSLLAAAGGTTLSVHPDAIPIVRNALLKLDATALRTMLPELFDSDSADEVEEKMRSFSIV